MTAQQSGPAGRHAQPAQPGLDSEDPYGTDAAGAGSSGPGLYERETAVAWASAWQVLILVAVVTLAAGVILLVWPKATVIVVAYLLGAALLVSGLFRLVSGFAGRGLSGGSRAAYVLIGLLGIFAGLYFLRHIDVAVVLLAFIVGRVLDPARDRGPDRRGHVRAGHRARAAGLHRRAEPGRRPDRDVLAHASRCPSCSG